MMKSSTLTAPAKVNLFLKVLNKRKDNYHNILTLFERISLADVITLSKIPSGIIVSSDKLITRDPRDNLAYKAAEFVLNKGKVNGGVRIHIKKRIPIAAGLGGGSSDAASVLMGLNNLFDLKLKHGELAALGKKLGADVPFFLLKAPFAAGRGRGDELKKINCKTRLWHLIIYPGFKMATKDIYEAFDLLTIKRRDVKIPRSLGNALDIKTLTPMLYNDLEEIAIAKNAVLGKIIERLASSLGRKAIVSGSGPSVFCLCGTRKEAINAKGRLLRSMPAAQRKSWQVFVARTEA